VTGPQTLEQWLSRLRREHGLRCRLHGERVRAKGIEKLPPTERAALFASVPQVHALLVRKAERRAKRRKQERQHPALPQRQRKVIGQMVSPGYPSLTRELFEDEVKDIRPSPRARQLVGLPYGWTK
jgi:hypothetical protein